MGISTDLIAQLETAADNYAAAIKDAPSSILMRKPDEKNWAPVEVICHVRDVEESYLGRFRAILQVDGFKFQTAEADRWAEERQYLRNDAFQALSAFRSRRKDTIDFLNALGPEQLKRTGIHPRFGRRTLAELAEGLAGHDANHLDQLKRSLVGQA